ncbi:hypothetical protein AVEN_223395-1 [Araneus ventricosus]|uniref:Uncharacterized protein n=1 Tax=Araneus ventricosus TaxID=182803 RepID=A0A4Y2KJZ7_ARAVE|nr:hypothetical protein AVEN_223395-1 [Araneus ventricosus]
MVIGSIINQEGCSFSTMTSDQSVKSVVLSKSTIQQERQHLRHETAEQLKTQFVSSMSVVHWDAKLLPDLSTKSTEKIDCHRLAVLASSLQDGSTKLLGVPKLLSGNGKAEADAVY